MKIEKQVQSGAGPARAHSLQPQEHDNRNRTARSAQVPFSPHRTPLTARTNKTVRHKSRYIYSLYIVLLYPICISSPSSRSAREDCFIGCFVSRYSLSLSPTTERKEPFDFGLTPAPQATEPQSAAHKVLCRYIEGPCFKQTAAGSLSIEVE